MGRKKQRQSGGLLTPEQLKNVLSFTEVKKAREEKQTGVKKGRVKKYTPDEYNRMMDLLLDSESRPIFRVLYRNEFPHGSNDKNSNNTAVYHYIASRKVHAAKRPIRREGHPWTWGDKYVLKIVAKQSLEKRACELQRVAWLLRREPDSVLQPLIQALRAVSYNTLKTAQEMGLLK